MAVVGAAQEDAAVVRRCLAGEVNAYEILVTRHQKAVYNAVLRMVKDSDDAEDLTQTAFVKAYENLANYDSKYAFFSWLYRTALNESINFLERRKKQSRLTSEITSDDPNPETAHGKKELGNQIQEAIIQLPIDYRVVIVMKHFVDFTYQEMSEILAIPEKTVKSRLFTARRKLSEILIECGITSVESV